MDIYFFLICVSLWKGSDSKLIQLPLISHEQQLIRRNVNLEDNNNDSNSQTQRFPRRPRRLSTYQRRNQNRNRRLKGTVSYLQSGPVYQGFGTHYVDIWIGNPPQLQTLIVDTGSSVTAFPCSDCQGCGGDAHLNPAFQQQNSSTFRKLDCNNCVSGSCDTRLNAKTAGCKIAMAYQEGSTWHAFEARDEVFVGRPPQNFKHRHNDTKFDLTFGCQTRMSGLFQTQLADGIMGMDKSNTSFWVQMFKKHDIGARVFSLCYARHVHLEEDTTATKSKLKKAPKSGPEAGVLTMGGYDKRLHKTPIVYSSSKVPTPNVEESVYSVRVRRIYLRHWEGGETEKATKKVKIIPLNVSQDNLNTGGVLIDSGSTDTYFTKRIKLEFRRVFKLLALRDFPTDNVNATQEQINKYPTILLQLVGMELSNKRNGTDPLNVPGLAAEVDPYHPYDVIIAIPPSQYMQKSEQALYEPRFYPYEEDSSGSILGANALMGHDIVFDVDRKKIGWAQSTCFFNKTLGENDYTLAPTPAPTPESFTYKNSIEPMLLNYSFIEGGVSGNDTFIARCSIAIILLYYYSFVRRGDRRQGDTHNNPRRVRVV